MAFLGFDLGTSYFKVGVFGVGGEMLGLGRVAAPVVSSGEGICEMPVASFWQALRTALAGAMRQAKLEPRAIRGLSYSSQANTFLLLDKNHEPLSPLVVWTDQRASPLDPALAAFGESAEFLRTAGFTGLAPGFCAAKWHWFQRQAPEVWSRTAHVMTIAEYFSWMLTGENCGDASTAALTGAWDVARGNWWDEALARFGVGRAQLSKPLKPGAACGKTIVRAAEVLGLPAGVPFAAGALDHYAGAIGAGIDRFSDVSISIGTVLAALRLGDYAPRAGSYVGAHWDGARFYRLTFTVPGAKEVENYRERNARDLEFATLLRQAAEDVPGANPDRVKTHGAAVRAIIVGLARAHARLLADLDGAQRVTPVLATGGGARSRDWLQITADVLGRPVVAPGSDEVACLGAAIFSAVAGGQYDNIADAAEHMLRRGTIVNPRSAFSEYYRKSD